MAVQNFRCPICREIDSVRKVSTIVISEMPSGPSSFDKMKQHMGQNLRRNRILFGGLMDATANMLSAATADPDRGYTTVRHHYHTQVVQAPQAPLSILVQRLAFPEYSYQLYATISSVTSKVGPITIFAGFALYLMYFAYVGGNFFSMLTRYPLFLIDIALFTICVVLSLLAPILKLLKKRQHKPARARAYALWDRLYYCYRDDVVFIGDDPMYYVPSEHMRRLLFPDQ